MKQQKNKKPAGFYFRPFVWVALFSGVVGVCANGYLVDSSGRKEAVLWFLTLWGVSCLNLAALTQAGLKVLGWMRDTGQKHSPALMVQVFFWGTIKFVCLILLGSLIWRSRSVPGMTLVLGLSTLVVVPLFGGYLWSRTDYARRTRF